MKYLVIPVFLTLFGCSSSQEKGPEASYTIEFAEQHRPQFHFSPPTQWMNDPNGMVYYEGEYHLFYQHYPDSNVWGPMHWGHAISTDLVNWEHLPIAIYPDSLGYIFSGSAVVDWNNTSGLGDGDKPPLVAIYTYHEPTGAKAGEIDFQYQGIAYSNDNGRTWDKYESNPVLANPGIIDFRDPKVIWHEESEKWVMVLAVKDHISFYSSPDLISWTFESDFGLDMGSHGGVWECPDLFELELEDGESAWVLIVSIGSGGPNGGSATQYFTGQFDGKLFTATEQPEETKWIDWGADNYAGVTWSDIPESDGRRIFIGWMSNWAYAQVVPTEAWRSAMTLPRELRLFTDENNNYFVSSWPVKEFDAIGTIAENSGEVDSLSDTSLTLKIPEAGSANLTLKNDFGESIVITMDRAQGELRFDRSNSGDLSFSDTFGNLHSVQYSFGASTDIRLVLDVSSMELFVDGGKLVMTELFFPSAPFTLLEIDPKPDVMETRAISSIWKTEGL